MTIQRCDFDLDLAYLPAWSRHGPVASWDRFPHAIVDSFESKGVILREQRMLDFVNQISDKPRWWEKISDDEIVSRWWAEASGEDDLLQLTSPHHLSKKCFDYCLAELRDKADYMKAHSAVHVLDTNATVIKSDVSEDNPFWLDLKHCACKLEDVPKDWHPGSNGLVLDLLHPSLFPLQYGLTRVLPQGIVPMKDCAAFTGLGEVCAVPDIISHDDATRQSVPWASRRYNHLKPWGRMHSCNVEI